MVKELLPTSMLLIVIARTEDNVFEGLGVAATKLLGKLLDDKKFVEFVK